MALLDRDAPVRLPDLTAVRLERQRRAAEQERVRVSRDIQKIRAKCKTLHGFIREAWHVLEPVAPFVDGWHIAFLCAHLEAITSGRFLAMGLENRLLINVPPGTMKSLIVSVFWPAWEWGPAGLPGMRYLATSYNEKFVKRDSRRMRNLVQSEWYRQLWPAVELVRAGEMSFENSATGFREGVPFGSLTGGRGDRLLIDDPHSTETAESDAEREATTRIFRESVPLRLNDPVKSAIIVIMQRLHAKDVSGVIHDQKMPYVKVRLPMEFEAEPDKDNLDNSGPCVTPIDEDPRTFDGELLWPERFTRDTVDRDKRTLGAYAIAGQLQQRPSSREGALFKRAWWQFIKPDALPSYMREVRHWDLAASAKGTGARTAGVRMGQTTDGRYIIRSCITERQSGAFIEKLIRNTAVAEGYNVAVSLPQDPGQAGKVQAEMFVKLLAGWIVQVELESGDKESRARAFASQVEAGNVYLVIGDWNEPFLDEMAKFPVGKLKDIADACSGAFGYLVKHPAYDASQGWGGRAD